MTTNFADRLSKSIETKRSFLVAGLDPVIDGFPEHYRKLGAKESSDEAACYAILVAFYSDALSALQGHVCALKPNLAFFEQYGIGGLRAFKRVCEMGRAAALPVIADAKRGDIDSSAFAYMQAFFGGTSAAGRKLHDFEVDALTINPYLGFDTLLPFVKGCKEKGKGVFVLVRTSNPGSSDLQLLASAQGSVAERVADFLAQHAAELRGSCGLSALGAVVGVTNPQHARELRSKMPTNYFLMPGLGAQGGTPQDAHAGLTAQGGGAVVNASRALLANFEHTTQSSAEVIEVIAARAKSLCEQLRTR